MTRAASFPAVLLTLCVGLLAACPTETPQPDAVTVSVAGAYSVAVGDTLQLTATTAGATDAGYSWVSSAPGTVSVTAGGLVTGILAGEAVITVTGDDSGVSGTHPVVVTTEGAAADPTVAVGGAFWVGIGEVVALTATTANGADASYSWEVDDDAVATIDADGNLTGSAPGTVRVTATGADTGASGSLGVVVSTVVPHLDEWGASAHADHTAAAFTNWDDDGAVPASCARCHSAGGFDDYIGADGSAVGTVDQDAATGTVIGCATCHSEAASQLDSVTFPSGVTIDGLGPEARCMTCHQGRSSTDTVDQAITDAGAADDDMSSADLRFQNIHYYAAGATIMAGLARGGYQYADKIYDVRFRHVDDPNSCTECHSPHSLEVQVERCAECHEGVQTVEDTYDIRMMASASVDFDGDGDLDEGIKGELLGVRDVAMTALQAYAAEKGSAICYSGDAYPYFFADTDGDGSCSSTEAVYANSYSSWTPRSLRAAYNVQVATKDPGAFAHNAKYLIELLYDSATDVNDALTAPADLTGLSRNDPSHFNGSSEAARHWDEDEELSANCSKCHGGSEGFRFYLEYGVGLAVPEQGNGLDCETCHESFGDGDPPYAVIDVPSFKLASGESFSEPDPTSNTCATCHSGRMTGANVQAKIDGGGNLTFQNVHYLPAAGTRRGGDGHLGFEYPGMTYASMPNNHLSTDACTFCHDPVATEHSFEAADAYAAGDCAPCHTAAGAVTNIRGAGRTTDYDGDGNAAETLSGELATMAAGLLAQINAVSGACYASDSYPYFFNGADPSGVCAPAEANGGNRFTGFTPATLKATYNYQVWSKDPGGWAHNFNYVGQLIYDSFVDLGGDPTAAGWTRP
jgi:hypothetical protein